MKKIILFLALGALALSACKKKDDPAPEPEPTAPVPVVYVFSVKVDGAEKKCSADCYSSIYSGGFRTVTLNLNSSAEQIIFNWQKKPVAGEYELKRFGGEVSVMYGKGPKAYSASAGTINILSVDTTASGVVSKIRANFAFKTDTLNGLFFDITNGTMDLK